MLIANDRPPRSADEPRRFDDARRRTPLFPTATRPALEPRRDPVPQSDSPDFDGWSNPG
ncbi:putative transmembrane protein [Mycobacterium kansasii]|uniref:Putative transmembrane protein n=1 Tax=Mycobacterium kansasii TaxID=1768 RepID=A0A1V3XU88_MYCKA|nr:putative transmembrane protein [Mycobacterium kansasii]